MLSSDNLGTPREGWPSPAPPYVPEELPTPTRRQEVVEWLGRRICGGDLPSRTMLNMADLAVERGVSRSVMREAMGVLATLGLVASRRRAGTVVQPMSEWELINGDVIRWRLMSRERAKQIVELTELRSAIEPAAAALAAEHAAEEDRAALGECMEVLLRAAEADDIPVFHDHDKKFHGMVLALGRNQMFGTLHRFVEGMLEARYRQGLLPQRIDPQAVEWHRKLGRSIIDRDPGMAREAAQLIVSLSAVEMLDMAKQSDAAVQPRLGAEASRQRRQG